MFPGISRARSRIGPGSLATVSEFTPLYWSSWCIMPGRDVAASLSAAHHQIWPPFPARYHPTIPKGPVRDATTDSENQSP